MKERLPFGSLAAEKLKVGDLVVWKNHQIEKLAIITMLDIKAVGGRLVSIAQIASADGSFGQAEVFTINLKVVSKASVAE
mgnify:CR=1 FL=1|tara:strand:+ start:841 stop:1080 length:240 start_codon:yes stop_codon:yes gene_type:complete